MSENRLINNLKGILYYLDTPLLDFEVYERQLIKADDLSAGKLFPQELILYGITYGNLNAFFNRRTLKEGCMYYQNHLRAYGMDTMDFDRYIMMNNGNNHLDNYWVRFDGFGARTFSEICSQEYPVC